MMVPVHEDDEELAAYLDFHISFSLTPTATDCHISQSHFPKHTTKQQHILID